MRCDASGDAYNLKQHSQMPPGMMMRELGQVSWTTTRSELGLGLRSVLLLVWRLAKPFGAVPAA